MHRPDPAVPQTGRSLQDAPLTPQAQPRVLGMRVIECRIPGGRGLDGFIPQHLSSSSPITPVPLPSCRPHTCTPAVLMTGSCITYRDDCRTSIHPQTALHPQLVLHLYLLLPLLLMNFSKQLRGLPGVIFSTSQITRPLGPYSLFTSFVITLWFLCAVTRPPQLDMNSSRMDVAWPWHLIHRRCLVPMAPSPYSQLGPLPAPRADYILQLLLICHPFGLYNSPERKSKTIERKWPAQGHTAQAESPAPEFLLNPNVPAMGHFPLV